MQAPPVVVHSSPFPPETLGAPALAFETWEIIGCATSFTGIIAFLPASGSSTGVTVE
jgi:hypothetical protein